MRVVAAIFVTLMLAAVSVQAQPAIDPVFAKLLEVQQHTRLSVHLNRKCQHLAAQDVEVLEWGSAEIAGMLIKHPANKIGPAITSIVDMEMERRAAELECNDETRAEMANSVANLRQFKNQTAADSKITQLQKDMDRLMKGYVLNRRCEFYDAATTAYLQDKVQAARTALLGEFKGDVAAVERELVRQQSAFSSAVDNAPVENACGENSEGLVRMVVMYAKGVFSSTPTLVPACPVNRRCPSP